MALFKLWECKAAFNEKGAGRLGFKLLTRSKVKIGGDYLPLDFRLAKYPR
jgi:hypothetical protein